MIPDDKAWFLLAETTAEAFRMDAREGRKLAGSRTARLIGSLPFAAGCPQAERLALAHLGNFVLASRDPARAIFDHKPTDDSDPLTRLQCISDFPGGEQAIIRKGMALLGLIMCSGYRHDRSKDAESNTYNPLNSGAWDLSRIEEVLGSETSSSIAPELDDLMTVEEAIESWWEG
ncbi:MAG: hypothetical protein A3J97_14825 [Spirochaetes bacterium RIFOXYC1_FULL_54_7]|nr:MAG: hypothetical protein A3J97_14825 [Spirochaetes bacterium RIFOXYC1_FULL_54_7]